MLFSSIIAALRGKSTLLRLLTLADPPKRLGILNMDTVPRQLVDAVYRSDISAAP